MSFYTIIINYELLIQKFQSFLILKDFQI